MSKYIIDLDKKFTNLNGEVQAGDDPTMAKQLATAMSLTVGKEGMDSIKLFSMAQDLFQTGKLVVDDSDRKTLRAFVNGLQLPIGPKAQTLLAIDNAATK